MATWQKLLGQTLEDSTTLWEQAPMAMRSALARHDEIMRAAVEGHGGRIVKTTGDGGSIISAVGEAMGYQFQGNGRGPKRQTVDYLTNKQTLLIMDNFEHLIDEGAEFVSEMLRSAPALKILVTSRQRLFQPGESLFTLAGLSLPAPNAMEDASNYAAVELFQQSARRARPDFTLNGDNLPHVIHICRLVQGKPLGILLAAPWVTALSTAEIVEEIQRGLDILEAEGSELPERQRSIRVVFDQAQSMMTEAERHVFTKLTVFRGGFTREAGQEVAGAGNPFLQLQINLARFLLNVGAGNFEVARSHLIQPFTLAVMTSSQPYMAFLLALAATIYAHDGRLESSVELLGLALDQPVDVTGWLEHWALLDRVRSELQEELGPAAFEPAWERGQSLDLKAAAEEVLQRIQFNGEGS